MKIVYMGTPQIAVAPLEALCGKHDVAAVFCQPDKPVGRKQILTACEVKQFALSRGIPVFQPAKMRDGTALAELMRIKPDLIVVMAYGKLLPPDILAAAPLGCVNIHASLLPKYRGAAPIQRAIERGETVTGVTFMLMNEGLDTGDILAQYLVDISENDDAFSMFERISALSAKAVCGVVSDLAAGMFVPIPQKDEEASFAPIIKKEDGLFSFEDTASDIVNKVRAFCDWPCAYFVCREKRIKVLSAAVGDALGVCGEVVDLSPLTVAAVGGSVVLDEVIPEGSRRMSGSEWAAGLRLKNGDRLEVR